MNSTTKKILAALIMITAIVAYPLTSSGKSENKNKIVLTDNNTVSLYGDITDESVANTIQALQKLDNKSKKPIYLFVYSPGGSVQAGFELIEAATGLDRPVNTITMFGASMAFQTVQALGERLILKNGVLMSHRAAGGFEGSFGGQYPSQLDSRYDFWVQRIKEMDERTVSRTNGKQTLETYQKQYANETWLTGKQSVDQGYADAIVTVRCDKSLYGTIPKQANFMGIVINYEMSKCPLITSPLNVKAADSKLDPHLVQEAILKFVDSQIFEKSIK